MKLTALAMILRVCVPGAIAAEPLPAETASRVRALIVQLGHPDLPQREAAEAALIELGPEALTTFPQVTPLMPPEIRDRLTRVRAHLERAMVSRVADPTRVTLHGEQSVSDIFEEITRQTGNRFAGHGGRSGMIRVDFQETAFWEAVDQLLDQSHLDLDPLAGPRQTLTVQARLPGSLPRASHAVYPSAFRLAPVRLESRRNVRSPDSDVLRVSLEMSWEPRLSPISIRQPLANLKACDEHRQPLPVSNSSSILAAAIESGTSAVELVLPLRLPDRQVRCIGELSGAVEVVLPGNREVFEFTGFENLRDAVQTKAAVSVTFEQWREDTDSHEARLRFRYPDAGTALESHRGWIYRNTAWLVSPEGERVDHASVQLTEHAGDEIGMAFRFPRESAREGSRFFVELPTIIEKQWVPYRLTNIALP